MDMALRQQRFRVPALSSPDCSASGLLLMGLGQPALRVNLQPEVTNSGAALPKMVIPRSEQPKKLIK
jgi:aminoglycoside/choline kinase family phosphotransferase